MKFREVVVLGIAALSISFTHAQELLKTTTTWEGGDIVYPEGQAEVTSFKLKIEEGETPKFHCHPVPTLGYILKGIVEVETTSGKKVVLNEGESVVEVLRTVHRGKAIGGPVEIIIFYAGSTTMPTTVLPENDKNNVYCKK